MTGESSLDMLPELEKKKAVPVANTEYIRCLESHLTIQLLL